MIKFFSLILFKNFTTLIKLCIELRVALNFVIFDFLQSYPLNWFQYVFKYTKLHVDRLNLTRDPQPSKFKKMLQFN